MRFLVIGPAPSCQIAGSFRVPGHRGLNTVTFRGRVDGKSLGAGIYTIVPEAADNSRGLPNVVAVAIDARGIRPTSPVRWRYCKRSTAGTVLPDTADKPGLANALQVSGVAAAGARQPAERAGATDDHPYLGYGWLPTLPTSAGLSAVLTALIAVSMALLGVAAVEPGRMLRFRTMRVIARHQAHMAWLGGGLLISAILLYFTWA